VPYVHHTYGYFAESGTAGILFTLEQADVPEERFVATISANTGDLDDPFFMFSVDQNNSMIINFLHVDQGYTGFLRVLQAIKGEETLDEAERALLDHLESFSLNAQFTPEIGADVAGQFWPSDATEEKTALAQFLRQMILDHTHVGLRVHEASPLHDDTVMVLAHDFVGIADEDEVQDLPRFQVMVVDPDSGAQYCLTQDFYGTKALYVDESGGVGGLDEPDDIEEFADVLGLHEPGKADVATMTRLLSDVWLRVHGVAAS